MWIARKLTGDPNLQFVEMPALAPKEAEIDPEQQKQAEKELAALAAVPLPDEDDDF